MEENTILYVDDDQTNLNSFTSLFKKGFTIVTAVSAEKGIEILESNPVQLVIAEQSMSEMTGIDLFKIVKVKWPEIKLILFGDLSNSTEIKELVNQTGIYWYLNKPFDTIQMELVLNKALEDSKTKKLFLESEAFFKDVFNSIIDVFIRRDLDHKGILVSPSVFEVTGYDIGDIEGKDISKFFIDPTKPDWIISYLLKHEGIQTIEFDLYKKDGSIISISSNAKLFYNAEGMPIGIESIFRDISERRKIEKALIESEQKFKMLVTNTEEIIYMIDKEGKFLLSEGKGLSKLGLESGDVVGGSVFELYKEYPLMLDEMKRAFEGETVVSELKIGNNYFKNWYTPHVDQNGDILGLLGLSINISEQKAAELKILQYQKRLRDLAIELTLAEEKMRKQIAIDLHDDVGQLLSASRMQMAAINYDANKDVIKNKISSISEGLLQAIQATREAIFNLSPPQLNEIGLFAAVHDWTKEQIEKKYQIKVNLTGNTDKYPLKESTRLLLFRSIRELLLNTAKHANANHLNITFKRKDKLMEITVQDDGMGFDENVMQSKVKSKAFGLFSINERMSDLGGSMELDSKIGIGTKIKLVLPLKK